MAGSAAVVDNVVPTASVSDVMHALGSSAESGLSAREAGVRLQRDGANEVPEKKRHPVLLFLGKFWGLSAWMIELIAVLSLILHKRADFLVALSLLVVNAVLSYLQEQRANAAVAALRQQLNVLARVLRDGTGATVPARALVRGDVARLRAGDFVPADLQSSTGW
jgi:magnesium-transporting ATPase (P-type)